MDFATCGGGLFIGALASQEANTGRPGAAPIGAPGGGNFPVGAFGGGDFPLGALGGGNFGTGALGGGNFGLATLDSA